MGLLEQTEENLVKRALAPHGTRLLAAVSGGVDSMVLLEVLYRLAGKHAWTLAAAHFNHQLRGAESDADEKFVSQRCQELQLPFYSGRAPVAAAAREKGISIEMSAREFRHEFLARTALQLGAIVALAHHADDQVETFWLRLLRGEAGPGVAGMQWKTRSSGDRRAVLIRPFLNMRKTELLEYAKAHSVGFREDSSNIEVHYQRNRLRHEILPRLEQFQPQLNKVTLRTAEVLLAEKDFIAGSARQWLEARSPVFFELHIAVQREVIRQQLLSLEIRPDYDLIENLRGGKTVTVHPGSAVYLAADGSVQKSLAGSQDFLPGERRVSLSEPGAATLDGVSVRWEPVAERGGRESHVEYFDWDALGRDALLRHWRPGDAFQPIGNSQPSKLQDLFTNLKVPAGERRERLLAESETGEIFWVEGLRIGEQFKIRPTTLRIIKWSWEDVSPSPT